ATASAPSCSATCCSACWWSSSSRCSTPGPADCPACSGCAWPGCCTTRATFHVSCGPCPAGEATHGSQGKAVPVLRQRRVDLQPLPAPCRGEDPDQGRARLSGEVVSAPRPRARADRRRRGLLPPVPRSLHQAAGTAAALQHPPAFRLPLRLRPVPRAHAALLPAPGRDHRPL